MENGSFGNRMYGTCVHNSVCMYVQVPHVISLSGVQIVWALSNQAFYMEHYHNIWFYFDINYRYGLIHNIQNTYFEKIVSKE